MSNATATLGTMADQEEPKPDEPSSEETAADVGGTNGWNERVRRSFSAQRFLRPGMSSQRSAAGAGSGQPRPSAATESGGTKAAVNSLDPREHRIALFATTFELVLTGVVVIPYLTHPHSRSTSDLKTLNAVHIFLIEGIVLFAVLLIGTLVRRRALVGFASLLVGLWLLEIKALSLLGIAYVGFGIWLIMKGLKFARGQGQGAARRPAAQPKPRKSRSSDKATVSRSAPKPNKRYTPPKAPRRPVVKKPAPARAEPPKH